MPKIKYEAKIEYRIYKDDFRDGEQEKLLSCWNEEYQAEGLKDCLQKCFNLYDIKKDECQAENINNYESSGEIHFSKLIDWASNTGMIQDPDKWQIKEWKKGKIDLYVLHGHIMISKVKYFPIREEDLQKVINSL